MQNQETEGYCAKCGRPRKVVGSGRLTEWIVACHCNISPSPETQAPELEICKNCQKRKSAGRAGSFTQWIFRSDLCKCDIPENMRPAVLDDVPSSTQEADLPEEDELEIPGNPPFPLNRYKPLVALGAGTSGRIYLCRDRFLGKKVAIKCLHNVTPEQLIAFQQEARAMSLLHHPGIVPVQDFGATESGAPYMVMDYVKGITLTECLESNGPLPLDLALPIFVKLSEILAYAHEKRLFHRDVQPSNILLVPVEGREDLDVRIIDFGIAAYGDTMQNRDILAGTPAYMSPDTANGLQFTEQSEVYALGCVMFEVLTGRPPFLGDTALETISMHAHSPAPALSDLNPTSEFPHSIETLIVKCLAKNPWERFPNMVALRKELLSCREKSGEIHVVEPDNVEPSPARASGFKPIIVAAAIAIAGVIAVVVSRDFIGSLVASGQAFLNFDKETESRKLTEQAWNELTKDNVKEAIALATKAIELDDENLNALDTRGVAYFADGDVASADRDFTTVIKRAKKLRFNPTASEFHHAMVRNSQGDRSEFDAYHERRFSDCYLPANWEQKRFAKYLVRDALTTGRGFGESPTTFNGIGNVKFPSSKEMALSALASDADLDAQRGNQLIEHVSISNCDAITEKGLSALGTMPNLKDVTFENSGPFNDRELAVLGSIPKLKDLLINTSDMDGSVLRRLPPATFQKISLQKNPNLTPKNLQVLAEKPLMTKILISDCVKISNEDIAFATKLPLRVLAWVPRFLRVSAFHMHRRDMRANASPLTFYDPKVLRELMQKPSLTEIYLDANGLTKECAQQLVQAAALRTLWLQAGSPVDADVVSAIAEPGKIISLYLCGTVISGASADALSSSTKIRRIGLIHSNLDRSLMRAIENSNIIFVDMVKSGYSSEDLENLKLLTSVKTLQLIDPSDSITDPDLNNLKRALPKCRIQLVRNNPIHR